MNKAKARNRMVLVGVLKRKQDWAILRREHWYRIPVSKMPRRKFHYLAFYEPARFGRQGKCIRSYARVLRYHVGKRRDLLPDEPQHPSAGEDYVKIQIGRMLYLPHPIKNMPPRRVSFGFATLERLLTSKNILQLYRIAPTEEILSRALRSAGIPAIPQYYISGGQATRQQAAELAQTLSGCPSTRRTAPRSGHFDSYLGSKLPSFSSKCKKRYCLDFAIVCRQGLIAVECDNLKAHSGIRRRIRDRNKNIFLRRRGWYVIRLTEHAIVSDIRSCIARVRRAVRKFGGLSLTDLPTEAPACRQTGRCRRGN